MSDKIKEAAWGLLLECQINQILDFEGFKKICKEKKWNLIGYKESNAYIDQFNLMEVCEKNIAITHFYDNQYTILFNDEELDGTKLNLEIAKQIGTIILKRTEKENNDKDIFEFACELRFPSILIKDYCFLEYFMKELGFNQDEIDYYCHNRFSNTDEISNRKEILNIYNDASNYLDICFNTYQNNLKENLIEKTFKVPIEEHKKKNKFKKIYLPCIAFTMIIVIWGIYMNSRTQQSILTTNESINNVETSTSEENTAIPSHKEDFVVITKTGSKYHLSDCSRIKNSDMTIHISLDEAIDAEYEPCLICKPDKYIN